MVSRIITCAIKPDKIDEFRDAINNDFLSRIQAQPGFLENIESCDPSSGNYCCVTLWNSQSDIEDYDKGLFKEIAARLVPMMAGNPTVQTLPVDNASAQKIQSGRMAAA